MTTVPAVLRRKQRPDARMRLLCFPHAGGAASFFRDWWNDVPDSVEVCAVQYPGRETRIREPFATSMEQLVLDLLRDLTPLLDRPVVLFGHSMGASVAYECAVRLSRDRPGLVRLLAVSARAAPSSVAVATAAALNGPEILALIRELGGTASVVLEHEELRELAVSLMRADLDVLASAATHPVPLPVPIVATGGEADSAVTIAELLGWSACTSAGLDLHLLAGGHFYLVEQQAALLAHLRAQASWPETVTS